MTISNLIPYVFEVDVDPSTLSGATAPIGSVAYLTTGAGGVWHKTGSSDTAWSVMGVIGQSTGVVQTLTPDLTDAEGSSSLFARADHIHTIPTAAAISLSTTTTNTQGASTSFARADHTHSVPSAAAVALTTASINTLGSSASFARADHTHLITTAAPVAIGSVNAAGSATTFVNSDHVHQGLHSIKADSGTARFGDVSLVSGTNVTITDDGSGNFTVAAVAAVSELLVTAGSGLIANYTAGNVWINGVYYAITAGSITLPASTASGSVYVGVNGVVSSSATQPPPPNTVPMAAFVTGASTITTITDQRVSISQELVFGLSSDITTILPNAAAAAGATNRYADAGHTHAIAVAAAATQGPDNANAAGSSTSFARADHVHNIPTAAAISLSTTTTNTQGASTSFARADHTHAVPSAIAVTISGNTNAVGTSGSFARADHTHQLTATAATQDSMVQFDGTNFQAVAPEALIQSSRAWNLFEEWVASSPSGNLGWSSTSGGGGSTVALNSSLASSNHPGVVQLNAGPGTARYAGLLLTTNQIILGGGVINLECEVYIETLATATNDYSMRIGFGDSASSDFTNGVYFEYTRATNVNWLTKTASVGTITSTATTTAVAATTWVRLGIQINAAASSVTYLINGTSVGTVTTNIPTASLGVAMNIVMAAGALSRAFDVDYLTMNQRFTSGR